MEAEDDARNEPIAIMAEVKEETFDEDIGMEQTWIDIKEETLLLSPCNYHSEDDVQDISRIKVEEEEASFAMSDAPEDADDPLAITDKRTSQGEEEKACEWNLTEGIQLDIYGTPNGRGLSTRAPLDLATDMERVTANTSGKLELCCQICKRECKTSSGLGGHMRQHRERKPLQCLVCNKKFARTAHLKVHMLKHTGRKPLQCLVCNRKFARTAHLKVHMLKHTGEKSFSCHICEKKFPTAYGLKLHVRTHTGDKPFPCHVCGKSFTKGSDLKRHVRIHTGEKPYICQICKAAFNQLRTLTRHMRSHTGQKAL